jgi:hypothetical protein
MAGSGEEVWRADRGDSVEAIALFLNCYTNLVRRKPLYKHSLICFNYANRVSGLINELITKLLDAIFTLYSTVFGV